MKKYLKSSLNKGIGASLLCCLFLISCKGGGNVPAEEAVASFGDARLSRSELMLMIPDSMPAPDSTQLAQRLIEEWMGAQALAEEAEKAIPDLDKKLQSQLDSYRLRLAENLYAQYLMAKSPEQLSVSEKDIQEFYAKHADRFISNTYYYQYFYVKTDKPQQYKVVNLIRSDKASDIQELITWSQENGREFKLDSVYVDDAGIARISDGFYYGDIRKASTATPYPYSHTEGSVTYYDFFRMLDVVKPGDALPLSVCRSEIEQTLRSRRLQEMMEETRTRLVQQAKAGKRASVN
ncbi:MAG: hypothetical protein EAZ89_19025 [Bacteroidetes bacterium]|jgi:hypothetical protein|nr:MAG: hypothetical protein EAZ89_19025 [Bacteroidota bacterium]